MAYRLSPSYVYSKNDQKVSLINIEEDEEYFIQIEGELAGIFLSVVEKKDNPAELYGPDEKAEILEMLESLVAEGILIKD